MINSTGGANAFGASQMSAMRDKMFSRIDTNSDNSIDKSEFSAHLANGPAGGKSAEEIFNEVDTDQDGLISKTENEDAMKKMAREGKANRPPMGGPQGAPAGGGPKQAGGAAPGGTQTEETSESEDKNYNGIPDDEEEDDSELSVENFLKEVLKKYAKNTESSSMNLMNKNISAIASLDKNLYA